MGFVPNVMDCGDTKREMGKDIIIPSSGKQDSKREERCYYCERPKLIEKRSKP